MGFRGEGKRGTKIDRPSPLLRIRATGIWDTKRVSTQLVEGPGFRARKHRDFGHRINTFSGHRDLGHRSSGTSGTKPPGVEAPNLRGLKHGWMPLHRDLRHRSSLRSGTSQAKAPRNSDLRTYKKRSTTVSALFSFGDGNART